MTEQTLQTHQVSSGTGLQRRSWVRTLLESWKHTRTKIGLGLVVLIILVALVGPLVAPKSPTEFVGPPFARPSGSAPLGADYLGRDVLTRFLYGGRSVLGIALAGTVFGVTVGAIWGLVAAYSRNFLDEILMRGNDVFLAFPQIVFVLLLVSTFDPSFWLLALAVGATHAPRVARVARGAALEIVERDFIKAAEAVGEKRRHIVLAELLPNVSSPLLVEFGLRMTYSIGLVAAISFLGFGLQPPAADWGLMINENRIGLTAQPYSVALPIVAIGLLTIGTNLVTDGIARSAIGIGRGA